MRTPGWVVFVTVCIGVGEAQAICREVTYRDSAPPEMHAEQSVLFVVEHVTCLAGMPHGSAPVDLPAALPCSARDAITMIVQPRFAAGPDGARFALLMATPSRPTLALASPTLLLSYAERTRPRELGTRTVIIEDQDLGYQCEDPKFTAGWNPAWTPGGSCSDPVDERPWQAPPPTIVTSADAGPSGEPEPEPEPDAGLPEGLQVLGDYEFALLEVSDRDALRGWFETQALAYSPSDLDAVAPYLDAGWTLVAVRVAVGRDVADAALVPLSFSYHARELQLPVGIARQSEPGDAFVTAYVLSDGRYEFPGAHVSYARPADGAFLTRNDLQLSMGPPARPDPVAFHRSGDPFHQDAHETVVEVRIPSSYCPGSGAATTVAQVSYSACGAGGGTIGCSVGGPRRARGRSALWLLLGLAFLSAVRRRASGTERGRSTFR